MTDEPADGMARGALRVRIRPHSRPDNAEQQSVQFYLPLYLVLLVFFVALTADGTYDSHRGSRAMISLNEAFSAVMPAGSGLFGYGKASRLERARLAADSAERLLEDSGFEMRAMPGLDGRLTMWAPLDRIYPSGEFLPTADYRSVLGDLAGILKQSPGSEVRFLIGGRAYLDRARAAFLDEHWPLIAPFVPADIGLLPEDGGLTVSIALPDASF